jgi:glycosyltransferase involved in cell wall biosynthesis
MDLSIVIPALNEEANLSAQLAALLQQEWDSEWEIVVVDNGSTDGTVALVEATAASHARLRLVSEPHRGLCNARNTGIKAARGSSVAICDADDIVAPGWVAVMGQALIDHELVTGPQETEKLNPAWLSASRGQRAGAKTPSFHGIFPYPNGNNVGLHRSLVDRIGWFDQAYIGAEDAEFGLRAWSAGVEMHFEEDAVVHYAYRTTARQLWRQGLGYGRHRPAIARKLAAAGKQRPSRFAGWKSWAWLLLHTPKARSREGRALLSWVAGNRVGHLLGSIRHRTILL